MADANLSFFLLCILFPIFLLVFLKLIVRPRPVKIPIKSRHVLITGGSRGIGLALTRQVAAEGARVTILARDLERLEEAKASIRISTGIDVAIVSADVRDFDAVKDAVESAGPIDVLICNQGVYASGEVENLEVEEIKGMIDVNLIGSFNVVKAVLPGMKNRSDRRPASIAFMSSQSGQVGIYGYSAYAANTDTPGLEKENKRRPPLTSIIAASSPVMKVDEVVEKALNGIKSGSFLVSCNFNGFLLSIETGGSSQQKFYIIAFVEVVLTGVLRVVALCLQRSWRRCIQKWRTQKKYSNK